MLFKKITLLFVFITAISITSMAQKNNSYTAQWKKVEAFEKKGLTASALKEVINIYNLAIKDKNDAQQIKSCMYQVKYRNMREEESQEKNIFFVDTLIAKAKAPAKNILQSMQAEMMWQYLQNHRWQFYNRTELKEEKSKDISTWSLEKLHAAITKLYKASLDINTEAVLKATKLEGFDAIIIKGENTRNLRPTLYDFLAFRALDYFMTDERDITKPASQFTINDPIAFAPAPQFAQHRFETKDTASLHYHALDLLRDILIWHIADVKNDALLDADLIRLNFAYQHAVNEDKEKLYEAALKNIEEKFSSNEASAQAMYLRAKIYYDKGQDFEPFSKTDNQYEIKRAKELLEAAIKKYPKSEGGINAQNLLNSILQPALSLETEKVNVPLQPFRTLVKYKNAQKVYFRLIKTTREEIKKIDRRDYDKVWQGYVAMKPLKSWSVALPDPLDYQEHSTEIKVDAVDNGVYFLLASIDENFSLDKNIIAKQLAYVSNISYIHNNENDYYVLNRDNGQPLANSKVQVWESKYDYNKSVYTETKAEQYTTDKNGLFKLKKTKEYRTIQLQVTNGSDELFMDENNNDYYGYNSYEEPKTTTQTFLFTDRSIYRPGQTVYFKGIVITKANKTAESKVIASFKSTLQLKDANGQKINELKMVTNEYGSYHGSFKLPEGSLNGQFSLYDSAGNGYSSFNVEEYKRPKFSVEVKKPAGTYRVNDSIKVTGIAKAYAGNNVDGAAVKYRVVRKVRYQPWWYWGYTYRGSGRKIMPPYGRNEEVEITNGNSVTDSKGEFIVNFKALPDESINKKDQPTFYYEVSADVTDLNGETRSGETSVAVAYQSLQLEIKLDDKIAADSLKNILVRSTNLNDIEEKANVTVTIQQLKSPGKIFRERYWEQPDQFVMSKDEYYGLFPYDVYTNENEVKNYAVGDKVFDRTDSSNKEWKVENRKLKAGWYKVVATAKDKYGEDVKAEKYILLTGNETTNTEAVAVNVAKQKAEPGEKISYDIKTGFDKIWLIQTILKTDSSITTNYLSITQENSFKNELPITDNERGGISLKYVFVKHNRIFTGDEHFEIPWSNKELIISYETFRDKVMPGGKEKWTLKVTGSKGEKMSAEVLTSMYDASLDLFTDHNWNRINIWPDIRLATSGYVGFAFHTIFWESDVFENSQSENFNKLNYYSLSFSKRYDEIIQTFRNGNGDFDNVSFKKSVGSYRLVSAPVAAAMNNEGFLATDLYDSIGNVISQKTVETEKREVPEIKEIQIRKNFNETAFFFPDLTTDAEGNVSFSVTMPEALTQWKLMTLAHTKDLKSGYTEKTLVAQKPLMVQPNAPRFMREGDKMEFSAKIVNLSDNAINGTAVLELLDAATNKPVDGLFKNISPTQNFTTSAGQSTVVKYAIEIPLNFNSALTYRIVAKSNDFSDGEEMSLPVLTNRTLVTESMPLNLRNTTKKDFKFEKLLNSGNSKTISNHALTVEYTSNPAWYAVQALPYLMEYPYECAEQTFNRYYANTLASYVSNSIPKLKAVFEKWKTTDTAALMSNLQKNEELKSALLQETPWVMDAQNEAQQKKNIALLFDMVKMSSETTKNLSMLKEMQSENGGFVWFKGGPDDRYITQYIITGIGHLRKLNAISANEGQQQKDIVAITKKAIPYLD
ncbi:MAG: alpha-2-macroglobulin family protein, partial [Bacteroidota bacterium]